MKVKSGPGGNKLETSYELHEGRPRQPELQTLVVESASSTEQNTLGTFRGEGHEWRKRVLMVAAQVVLMRILGPNGGEVTAQWRKLHKEELHQILLVR